MKNLSKVLILGLLVLPTLDKQNPLADETIISRSKPAISQKTDFFNHYSQGLSLKIPSWVEFKIAQEEYLDFILKKDAQLSLKIPFIYY